MDDLLREFLTESASISTRSTRSSCGSSRIRTTRRSCATSSVWCTPSRAPAASSACLPRLEALAHAAETLMGRFRDGMPVSSASVTLILSTLDRLKAILGDLEATGSEPAGGDADLIEALEHMAEGGGAPAGGP